MRFLKLIEPALQILPEVGVPERKVITKEKMTTFRQHRPLSCCFLGP
jgi:hypothetical protein